MIIWKGYGFLGLLIPALLLLAVNVLLGDYYREHLWIASLVLLLSAVPVYFVGKKLASKPGKELIDPANGSTVTLKPSHSLFFIPLQYFSVALVGLAIFSYFR